MSTPKKLIGLSTLHRFLITLVLLCTAFAGSPVQAQITDETYAFKTYATNYGFYPIVQVYFRTFDQNRDPLQNVNYANIGLMVKGQIYDPQNIDIAKHQAQYTISTLEQRKESFRTVIVWDCSNTMGGQPFLDARTAIQRFIEAKRPGDQVAILAIRDTAEGYQKVTTFEKDPTMLAQRIADVKCDGQKTRLYDSIGAALEMCATASQGDMNPQGAELCVLSSIIVVSDGKDEGSAISREELVNRIGNLKTAVPVFSLAYSKIDPAEFKNLEAISKATFGRYWNVNETQSFGTVLQKIHQINRMDYVVTFRSYVPVDGERHSFKIGLEYPSGSGKRLFQSGEFEAIDPGPALEANQQAKTIYAGLNFSYPLLPQGPYKKSALNPGAAVAEPATAVAAQPASAIQPAGVAPEDASKKKAN